MHRAAETSFGSPPPRSQGRHSSAKWGEIRYLLITLLTELASGDTARRTFIAVRWARESSPRGAVSQFEISDPFQSSPRRPTQLLSCARRRATKGNQEVAMRSHREVVS